VSGTTGISSFRAAANNKPQVSMLEFGLQADNFARPICDIVELATSATTSTEIATFIYEETIDILWFHGDGTGLSSAPVAIA
jgi:hypothetical protein